MPWFGPSCGKGMGFVRHGRTRPTCSAPEEEGEQDLSIMGAQTPGFCPSVGRGEGKSRLW